MVSGKRRCIYMPWCLCDRRNLLSEMRQDEMKPGQKTKISTGKTYLFTQYSTPMFLGGLVAIFIPMMRFKESISMVTVKQDHS